MEEIKRMVEEIERDIAIIELPEIEKNAFFKRYPYSRSKLEKDFKKYTGKTLRNFLVEKKVIYLSSEIDKNPNISRQELMDRANYNYDEKTLRNHLKSYGTQIEEQFNTDHEPWEINFFHNAGIISEILVRFLLLCNLAKKRINKDVIFITHNVHNSFFQFNGIFPIEEKHYYKIFLDLDTLSLKISSMAIKDIGNKEVWKQPTNISSYISYLYTIDMKLKKQIGYSLIKAIKNWQECNRRLTLNSIVEPQKGFRYYHYSFLDKKDIPLLEINRKSKFIQDTDVFLEELKNKLLDKYKRLFMKEFKLPLETFIEYAKSVKTADYDKMRAILQNIKRLNPNSINAFFSLTSSPYLEPLINDSSEFNSEVSSELCKCSKEQLIYYVFEYKKAIEGLRDDEDYEEFDPNEWFKTLKEKEQNV